MFPLLSFELSNCLFCKRLVPRSSIPTYFITVVAVVVVLLYYLSTYICLPFECYRLSQFNFHRSYLHPFVCVCACIGVLVWLSLFLFLQLFYSFRSNVFTSFFLFVFIIFQSKELHTNIKSTYRVIQSSNQIRLYLHSEYATHRFDEPLLCFVLLLLPSFVAISRRVIAVKAQVFNKDSLYK